MYLLPSHKTSEAFSFYMWFMWLLFIYLFIVFLAMEKTTSSIHPICTRLPLHLATQPWVLLFECLSCLYIFLLCSVLPIKQRNGQTQQSVMKTLNFNVDLIQEKGISAWNELKFSTAYFGSWTWPPLLCLGPPTSRSEDLNRHLLRACAEPVSVL